MVAHIGHRAALNRRQDLKVPSSRCGVSVEALCTICDRLTRALKSWWWLAIYKCNVESYQYTATIPTPTPLNLLTNPYGCYIIKICRKDIIMGKVKAMYMEQEEQIMEWYYDGITLDKAKHLAELSFGPSVIDLVESIYTYGEDYEMMSSEGCTI